MNTIKVVGLMSGTSLDGLDIAYCTFIENTDKAVGFELGICETIPYPESIITMLQKTPSESAYVLAKAHTAYSDFVGQEVNKFLSRNKLVQPEFIASHGHTLFHNPPHFTFQLGSGAALASITGLPVICDFRSNDVALGGQGAPLVPIGDRDLFGQFDACLNLGGIANISYGVNDKRVAFDICPVNMALNYFANKLGKDYDNEGLIASKSQIDTKLLHDLNELDFYNLKGAKSLGREWFEENILNLTGDIPPDIGLATFSEHIAIQLLKIFTLNDFKNVLFTGGGTKNTYLINLIKSQTKTEIVIPETKLIDFKEALVFAYLGFLRHQRRVNVLSSVTGARRDTSSGAIYLP